MNVILYLTPVNETFTSKAIQLTSSEAVKIGRRAGPSSVPEPFNGYFDAKVLSRSHAQFILKDALVYIQDLQSSNGTFINGNRLSEEGQQSKPFLLNNTDLLEFGVDINDENGFMVHQKVAAIVTISFGVENTIVQDSHVKGLSNSKQSSETLNDILDVFLILKQEEIEVANQAATILDKIRKSIDQLESESAPSTTADSFDLKALNLKLCEMDGRIDSIAEKSGNTDVSETEHVLQTTIFRLDNLCKRVDIIHSESSVYRENIIDLQQSSSGESLVH